MEYSQLILMNSDTDKTERLLTDNDLSMAEKQQTNEKMNEFKRNASKLVAVIQEQGILETRLKDKQQLAAGQRKLLAYCNEQLNDMCRLLMSDFSRNNAEQKVAHNLNLKDSVTTQSASDRRCTKSQQKEVFGHIEPAAKNSHLERTIVSAAEDLFKENQLTISSIDFETDQEEQLLEGKNELLDSLIFLISRYVARNQEHIPLKYGRLAESSTHHDSNCGKNTINYINKICKMQQTLNQKEPDSLTWLPISAFKFAISFIYDAVKGSPSWSFIPTYTLFWYTILLELFVCVCSFVLLIFSSQAFSGKQLVTTRQVLSVAETISNVNAHVVGPLVMNYITCMPMKTISCFISLLFDYEELKKNHLVVYPASSTCFKNCLVRAYWVHLFISAVFIGLGLWSSRKREKMFKKFQKEFKPRRSTRHLMYIEHKAKYCCWTFFVCWTNQLLDQETKGKYQQQMEDLMLKKNGRNQKKKAVVPKNEKPDTGDAQDKNLIRGHGHSD